MDPGYSTDYFFLYDRADIRKNTFEKRSGNKDKQVASVAQRIKTYHDDQCAEAIHRIERSPDKSFTVSRLRYLIRHYNVLMTTPV